MSARPRAPAALPAGRASRLQHVLAVGALKRGREEEVEFMNDVPHGVFNARNPLSDVKLDDLEKEVAAREGEERIEATEELQSAVAKLLMFAADAFNLRWNPNPQTGLDEPTVTMFSDEKTTKALLARYTDFTNFSKNINKGYATLEEWTAFRALLDQFKKWLDGRGIVVPVWYVKLEGAKRAVQRVISIMDKARPAS